MYLYNPLAINSGVDVVGNRRGSPIAIYQPQQVTRPFVTSTINVGTNVDIAMNHTPLPRTKVHNRHILMCRIHHFRKSKRIKIRQRYHVQPRSVQHSHLPEAMIFHIT
jgi:hypothetical protein